MNKIDKQQSDSIWNMKAFAVIAIVACHCCQVKKDAGAINQIATCFLNYWISYGVPVFYFLAGYLFHCDEDGCGKMIQKKIISILIPWLITGTAVWLYVVLRKGGVTLYGWFSYLFLRESYLYFLTDLFLCFVLFYFVKKYQSLRYAVSGYFVAGIVLLAFTQIDLFAPFNIVALPVGSVITFYLGILACEYDCLKGCWCRRWCLAFIPFAFIRFLQLHELVPVKLSFMISILGQVSLFAALYSVSYWIRQKKFGKWMTEIGRRSFPIYLLHMPVAGFIAWVLNKSEAFAVLTVWRPLIVIAITVMMIKIYEKIVRKSKFFMVLIGAWR